MRRSSSSHKGGVYPKLPMYLWCILLPQTVITFNLVKPYHVAPKDSAHTYLNGYFDYNDMPLSPLGCKVHLYVKPHKRKAWDEHSTAEYYVGTSDENYMCHKI